MHKEFCMICDRPKVLLVDDENRPHCETGPFCRWRDESALYSIHGVRVPKWVVEHPDRITPKAIDSEPNVEIRRIMIDRMGVAKYLADAPVIHSDDFGTLYRKEQANDEAILMLKVINSTPEPDGEYKDYFLRVPPDMKTARQAVAWTFGKKEHEYDPCVET